jgi:hypothetical protein
VTSPRWPVDQDLADWITNDALDAHGHPEASRPVVADYCGRCPHPFHGGPCANGHVTTHSCPCESSFVDAVGQ